jgi:histidinol-phosphatase (PHP family)
MVSLHGGHSGEFCDHAAGALRALLEAAVAAGYTTFGVSEHAPRGEERFLYEEERSRGWDVAKMDTDFAAYTTAIQHLASDFAGRLTVLRGFEAEVVPSPDYADRMNAIRRTRRADGLAAFDYCVGSVHYVDEMQIDGPPEALAAAARAVGGIEPLAVRYYETVAEMIVALRPEVVGHLDLIKKNIVRAGLDASALRSTASQAAADKAIEAARANGCILDLNTAGWRKGLGEPYPARWLIERAHVANVPFCFGDDSHRASEVGAGLPEARALLLECGVKEIASLERVDGGVRKVAVALIP